MTVFAIFIIGLVFNIKNVDKSFADIPPDFVPGSDSGSDGGDNSGSTGSGSDGDGGDA